ncbi:DUF4174 domain-containing protein [Tautonia sociabilis]|uniref:DUF4174 domain-containing protein n=1 Tax=Tautonia sociabilis TaxID=2080755 RepID=A0A432MPB6_9BACT|nr:DUF4174 domain-containing protein [Tautonia sociabilis]RUL89281.1 DUF4174 domain-containing protein [Tautonia sociabilis]
MSRLLLILASPFLLAVLIGWAIPDVEPIDVSEGPMAEFSMLNYRWEKRVILVFATTLSDPNYQHAANETRRWNEALDDRDVVVITAVRDGFSRAGDRLLDREDLAKLRSEFGVGPEEFALILVDLDGTEEARWDHVPPMDEIFDRLDAMTRKREEEAGRTLGGDGSSID